MHDLQLVGLTTDRRGLIFRPRVGARTDAGFVVPVTDDLVALVAELADELAAAGPVEPDEPADTPEAVAAVEPAAKPRSQMSVRDIQARLRAGEPVAQVAREAGVDEDWIERFAPPIRAEQRRIVDRALEHHLQRARSAPSAVPLRRAVGMALADKGIAYTVAAFDAAWSAHLLGHDRWTVSFTYRHRGRDRTATWTYDAADDELTTSDRTAAQLGYVAPGAAGDGDGQAIDGIIGDPEAASQIGTASPGRTRRGRSGPTPRSSGPTAEQGSAAPASKRARPKAKPTGKAAAKKGATKKAAATTKKARAAKKASAAKKAAATKKAQAAKKAAATKKAQAAKKTAATKKAQAAKKAAATKKAQAAKKKAAATKKAEAAKKKAAATKKAAAAKRSAAKKTAAGKSAPRSSAKKSAAKRSTAKKSSAKKSAPKKAAAEKAIAKKSTAKKAARSRAATEKRSATKAAPAKSPDDAWPAERETRDDMVGTAVVAPATAPEPAPGDVVATEAAPSVPVTAPVPPEVVPSEPVEVEQDRADAPGRIVGAEKPAAAPTRLPDDTRPSPRDTRRPDEHAAPARRVAGRPGQVPIADVPLARRPPVGNGRTNAAGRPAPAPDDPRLDPERPPAEPDPAAARRARAAERNAPTVQFRSGSAAPVRAAGATSDGRIRRSPEPPTADRSRTEPGASNGAANPESRRRRQLRAR